MTNSYINEYLNNKNKSSDKEQCLHKKCDRCNGTGIQKDGTICIHMIACYCEKCTPRC